MAGVAWTPMVLAACASSARSKSTVTSLVGQPSGTTTAGGDAGSSAVTSTTPGAAAATSNPTSSTAPAPAGGAGAPAVYVDHGDPNSDMVALTFHLSGAAGTVTDLLDLLQKRAVTVTAFAVGKWITANPVITKRVVSAGHELGNHTEHHLDMGRLTAQQLRDEIVECGQAITPFIGSIGRWFRPSATVVPGAAILKAAGEAGYPVSVGYDIDSVDNKDPGAAAIIANVKPKLHGGAIVSLHFGHRGTIEALPHILDELAARKLRPVTVGTLLG